MIGPTPPRARSAKYSASRPVSRARSSRPVCIEPITTRLRSVVKPRSNGDSRCGYVTSALCSSRERSSRPSAVRASAHRGPLQCRGDFVEPVDGAFLRADATTQHQVLMQRAAAQAARVRKLPLLESAVGVKQFGALGPQPGHLGAQRVGVAVPGAPNLDRNVAGAVIGYRAAPAGSRV